MNEVKPGEVWQTQGGDEWFVVQSPGQSEPHMVNAQNFVAPSSFMADTYGPLTRIHSPGGAS